jgi:uncharacterized protein YfiM (DUF2279 family)
VFAVAPDKLAHTGLSAALAMMAYEASDGDGATTWMLPPFAGVAKEAMDSRWDWGDFSADVLGTALGYALMKYGRYTVRW